MVVQSFIDLTVECCKPKVYKPDYLLGCTCSGFWQGFLFLKLPKSTSQDLDFIFAWVYYFDEIDKGELREELMTALLVVTILHSVFYIVFVLFQLLANLAIVFVSCSECCKCSVRVADIWWKCYLTPRLLCSMGMIQVYFIISVDISKVVLTSIIQYEKGESIWESFALVSIISASLNALFKLIEAVENIRAIRKLNLNTVFRGHSDTPIFVGILDDAHCVSASNNEIKCWNDVGCLGTTSTTIGKKNQKINCMAQKDSVVCIVYENSNHENSNHAFFYKYDTPNEWSVLQHNAEINSITILEADPLRETGTIVVSPAGQAFTYNSSNGKWEPGTTYRDDVPLTYEFVVKFGDSHLFTVNRSVDGEVGKIHLWNNNGRLVYGLLDKDSPLVEDMIVFYCVNGRGRFVTRSAVNGDSRAGIVKIWDCDLSDPPNIDCICILAEDARSIGVMGSTEENSRLLIGSFEGTLTVWKIKPIQREKIILAHNMPVTYISRSTYGTCCLTGAADRTVCLWNV
jgi:WD40 repeat protein